MAKQTKNETFSGKGRVTFFIATASFFAGALIAGTLVLLLHSHGSAFKATGLRESNISTAHSDYTFIDPLLGIKGVNNAEKFEAMQKEVAAYIESEKQNGLVSASVDFRDINESGGFVVNPDALYTPASLNKVPVMMAYYKIAEKTPGILTHVLTYSGATNTSNVQEIRSAVQLIPGKSYTVEQLIEHMIRYSDNNAADLLTDYLKETNNLDTYITVFSDLGTSPTVLSEYTDNMTVRNYSMFLRALYNATYLTRDASEHALKLLSETDFSEGIESGVPNNTLVAEKFGEVRMTDANHVLLGKEINNCGIVYFPGHPYLLCIMTKATGDNIKVLEGQIASISRIIYKNMQKLYP